MPTKPNILAICGSTRKASVNHLLIQSIAAMNKDSMEITLFEGLDLLPHFNPDLDPDFTPADITAFRKRLSVADAVLICTPEYALGVPGTLKNALDWIVSTMDFTKKPVALITASLSGKAAHQSLLGTLLIIGARMTATTELLIPAIKAKISTGGEITDAPTLEALTHLSHSLKALTQEADDELLGEQVLVHKGI